MCDSVRLKRIDFVNTIKDKIYYLNKGYVLKSYSDKNYYKIINNKLYYNPGDVGKLNDWYCRIIDGDIFYYPGKTENFNNWTLSEREINYFYSELNEMFVYEIEEIKLQREHAFSKEDLKCHFSINEQISFKNNQAKQNQNLYEKDFSFWYYNESIDTTNFARELKMKLEKICIVNTIEEKIKYLNDGYLLQPVSKDKLLNIGEINYPLDNIFYKIINNNLCYKDITDVNFDWISSEYSYNFFANPNCFMVVCKIYSNINEFKKDPYVGKKVVLLNDIKEDNYFNSLLIAEGEITHIIRKINNTMYLASCQRSSSGEVILTPLCFRVVEDDE